MSDEIWRCQGELEENLLNGSEELLKRNLFITNRKVVKIRVLSAQKLFSRLNQRVGIKAKFAVLKISEPNWL
jgi:hypothetical protein